MKIKRVDTRAFAVSEKRERKLESKLKKGVLSRKVDIKRAYRPIVKFNVFKQVEVHKGIISEETVFEGKENHLFVDLVDASLYYFQKPKKILRHDILKRLLDVSPGAVRLYGELLEKAHIFKDEAEQSQLLEIINQGLVKIYKPTAKLVLATLVDEIGPSSEHHTLVKDRIKIAYNPPKFESSDYDLSSYLDEADVLADSYEKDSISHSIETLSELIANLFGAKVSLEGLFFIPYVQGTYTTGKKKKITPEMHFPLCFLGERCIKKTSGTKIKPIALSTSIDQKGTIPVEELTIDFSDVVNLKKVKDEIKDSIIYPLTKPELAKEFGKKGGGAILLYGPPGCGKTYIARATVGECGVDFFNINISEIIGKGAKEEAESLHRVFVEAEKNAPSILFFDEVDAIGGRRTGATQYEEKMEIDQFLMEMDGVETLHENVLIIAATNAPWNIDPALRRSVRFTRHIFVPPPSHETREALFKKHTEKRRVSEDIDFKKLAEMMEGYASSDIKAVCDAAVNIPWQEAVKGGERRRAGMNDFLTAVKNQKSSLRPWFKLAQKELKKSGEMDVFEEFSDYIIKYGGGVDEVKKPSINFSDVGNMEGVKEEIRKNIIYPLKKPELAKEFKKKVGGAILLYGPPGCGKTYIARATAGECEATFFNVKLTDVLSKEVGESEKNIQDIFDRASKNIPAILFFDEIDAIGGRRESSTTSEKRLVNSFLTEMDGFKKKEGLMIVGATNVPWEIDPALRRAGRFTQQLYVPRPDMNARMEVFMIHTRNEPIEEDIDFRKLAEMTEGNASSDIKALCELAAEIPWEEAMRGKERRKISMEDFMKVIDRKKSSLRPWYSSAERQIQKSGEREIYDDLLDDIEQFKSMAPSVTDVKKTLQDEKKRLGLKTESERGETRKLREEKKKLEEMIKITKKKFKQGEIGQKVLDDLVEEYERKLIEIEVKLKK